MKRMPEIKRRTPIERLEIIQQTGLLKKLDIEKVAAQAEHDFNAVTLAFADAGDTIIFDFRQHAAQTEIMIEAARQALMTVRAFVPEANFNLQELSVLSNHIGEINRKPRLTLQIRIKSRGRTYSQKISAGGWNYLAPDFVLFVNRMLADANRLLRVCPITMYCEDCDSNVYNEDPHTYKHMRVDPNRFGVLRLTQDQYDVVWRERVLWPWMTTEVFSTLSQKQIERFLRDFQDIGLFVGLSPEILNRGRERLFEQSVYDKHELLKSFRRPSNDYHFALLASFDLEADDPNAYLEETEWIGAISRGAFKPSRVWTNYAEVYRAQLEDPLDDVFVIYGFELNGKTYETGLDYLGGWLDESFVSLINKALSDQGVEGQFYAFDNNSQILTLIFLSPEQYAQIKQRHLLDLRKTKKLNLASSA
jgi:hypothetical protein